MVVIAIIESVLVELQFMGVLSPYITYEPASDNANKYEEQTVRLFMKRSGSTVGNMINECFDKLIRYCYC